MDINRSNENLFKNALIQHSQGTPKTHQVSNAEVIPAISLNEKCSQVFTQVGPQIAQYLLLQDLFNLSHTNVLGRNAVDAFIRERFTLSSVENDSPITPFLTTTSLKEDYENIPVFKKHIDSIASTPQDTTKIRRLLASPKAQKAYKDDPIFKQFIDDIFSHKTQKGYSYVKALEIFLRDEPNITPQDLINIGGQYTPDEIANIDLKKPFSDKTQNFLRKNLPGFFTQKQKILVGAFFQIDDQYIEIGVGNTYYMQSQVLGNLQKTTPEKREKARFALDKMLESNMFRYAHRYENNHYNPVFVAAFWGIKEDVEKLVDMGMPINEPNGQTYGGGLHGAVHLLARDHKATAIFDYFLEPLRNANISAQDKNGETPLHVAAKFGLLATVQRLTEKLTREQRYKILKLRYQNGQNPLYLAAEKGSTAMFWHFAQRLRASEILELLQLLDSSDMTSLHSAAKAGHFKMVTAFINLISQINKQLPYQKTQKLLKQPDKFGSTFLHYIAQAGDLKNLSHFFKKVEFEQLYELLNIRDNNSKTPLDIKNASGHTFLELAIEEGNVEMIGLLNGLHKLE